MYDECILISFWVLYSMYDGEKIKKYFQFICMYRKVWILWSNVLLIPLDSVKINQWQHLPYTSVFFIGILLKQKERMYLIVLSQHLVWQLRSVPSCSCFLYYRSYPFLHLIFCRTRMTMIIWLTGYQIRPPCCSCFNIALKPLVLLPIEKLHPLNHHKHSLEEWHK